MVSLLPSLRVGGRGIGDLGRAAHPRRSLPLGPEQLSGSFRVHSAARSLDSSAPAGQDTSLTELWHRQDGAVNRLAEQHSGEVAVRVDRLLVAPALQLVRVIDLPPVVEASLLLVLRQRRRGTAARRGGAARGEG